MAIKRIDLKQIAGKITRTHLAGAAVLVAVVAIAFYAGRGAAPTAKDEPPAPPPLPLTLDVPISAEARARAEFNARAGMLSVFFHEAGHMAISELKIPATGPQEDAVDEFSAFILTDMLRLAPDAAKPMYATIVWAGALLNRLWGQEDKQINWTIEHAPSERRFFSVLCLATGADPVRFIPIAMSEGVNQERLIECAKEYETKHAAWNQLMAPHAPGFWSKLTGHGRLKLVVGEATKPEWLAFEKVYTNGEFFQKDVLDSLSSTLALPRDIDVVVKGCGIENAWWRVAEGQIILCHDYFQKTLEMFARYEVRREQAAQKGAAGAGGGAPAPAPGPAPGPGTPAPPAPAPTPAPAPPAPAGGATAETLAGSWVCQGQTAAGFTREETTLARDGSFRTNTAFANGRGLQVWGRWSVQGSSLRYEVAGSNPPAPIQNPLMVPFQMTGANTLTAGGLSCQKTGPA